MKHRFQNTSGFTLVELIIGMTIFAIGLSAVYALLQSTMGNASYSRHEIVVANILREEIELVKNIRDTNIRNFLPWDNALIENSTALESSFASGVYIIENDFTNSGITIDPMTGRITKNTVKMKRIDPISTDTGVLWETTMLYTDDAGRYTHTVVTGSGTPYASYVTLTPLSYQVGGATTTLEEGGKPQGYIIDARVIIRTGGKYRMYDAKSAITNWIK